MKTKLKKAVLSGNEAIARGAYEAGLAVVSSYPGTPSTEITEYLAKYDEVYSEWATNEAVAMEVALGASLAGVRAMAAFKHVGLNVAADPLMTSAYTGINGGLVLVVADDPNSYSSQNEQDSRHYARMAKLPMLEPADSSEAYLYTKRAYELSEEYGTPVFLRSVTRLSHSLSIVKTEERHAPKPVAYVRDTVKWVMTPVNSRVRHKVLEKRIKKLVAESEQMVEEFINSNEIGIVTSGIPFQYVREALPDASVLKLGMVWPLPMAKISDFAAKVKKLYVIEELDPLIETEIRAAGINVEYLERSVIGELSVEAVEELFGIKRRTNQPLEDAIPVRLPNMCAGCSHRGFFYAVSRMKLTVTGDIGCYTLGYMPPLSVNDTTVCMGASVSMAHGFDKGSKGANTKNSIGVIGDSTFLHSGVGGLINSVFNGGHSTVVILDNRITGMTGHQANAASGYNIKGEPSNKLDFEALCRAIGVNHIQVVDPFDVEACTIALKEALNKEEVSVIITNRPCIFVDKEAIKTPYVVMGECSGCKACLRLGCPAISWDNEKKVAVIDEIQCTGCGLCPKVCRFSAIEQVKSV